MSSYADPRPPTEPTPYSPLDRPPARREVGEGRGGVLLAIAAILGLLAFGAVLLVFPALLAWILAIGLLALVLLAVAVVLVSVVVGILMVGVGAFHLFRRNEVQGPEVSYTLDMVREPPKGNV